MAERTGAGRVAEDAFHLDRTDGTADPYADYRMNPGIGGQGRGPYQTLDRPFSLELNNWVRFDKPGKYRVYLETRRLFPGVTRGVQYPTIRMASNILELEILPAEPDWINSELKAAIAVLAATRTPVNGIASRDAVLQRTAAIRTLKNLQTEEAARVLVKRMSEPNTDNSITGAISLALYASRHRSVVIDELRQVCADPTTRPPSAMALLERLGASLQIP